MSEKHTPGPWEARRRKGAEYVSITDARGESVGSAYGGNAECNARLLAAAPDLLAALEMAYAELDREYGQAVANGYFPTVEPILRKCQAALRKARGE